MPAPAMAAALADRMLLKRISDSLVEPIKEAPDAAQKDTPEEMQKETALQLKEGPETTRKETQQENLDETPESDEQH